jgi:outer membrane lipoprotein carrier protein
VIRAALAVLALASAPLDVLTAQAGSPDAGAIITRATRTYKALSGLQADFRQRIEDPFLGPTDARGVLSQSGATRFAMRFSDPANEAIVIDGTKLWVYLPSNMPGQVLRYPAPSTADYGVNLLAWLLERPLERYRVSYVRTEEIGGRKADVLLLEAIADDIPFRRATVWFDREDALPRRLEFNQRNNVKRVVELSRLRPNASIPASTFIFTPPSGVKVVDQKS